MTITRFAVASLLLLPTSLWAQADSPGASAQEILVTGKGLPDTPATPAYDTQVLQRDQIVSSGSGRIEDVLSSIAGFQQFRRSDSRSSNPSAQGVTLRALGGNASSRALVLLDGVPLSDPFFGYIPLSAVAPERLERIRVTRGGGSGPFGAGALAGTIELESADPAVSGPVNLSALVNDRAETELSGSVAPKLGDGFAVVSGRWDRGKGFYTAPVDQRVDASARAQFDSWSTSARLVQPLTQDLEIQLRGLAFNDERTLRFDGADSSHEGQDISLRLISRGAWQVDALAYVQWRNFTNVVISSSSYAKVLDQKDTPSTGLGGKLEIRPPVGDRHVLRIGTDYRHSDGDLAEDGFSGRTGALTKQSFAGGENSDLGFFIEDDWTLGPLILTGGLRADRWTIRGGYFRQLGGDGSITADNNFDDRSGWDVSYRAGAVFDAGGGLSLRGAAYSGLRLPTLNELYRPFTVFPVVTNANAELENERLHGVEVGLDWRAIPGVTLSLTAFDNQVKHAIANVTLAENLRERRNLDAIDAQGLELGAAVQRGAFSFDGSLAYSDAVVDDNGAAADLDGLRPSQTPEWAASGTLRWKPRKGSVLAATMRYVGGQYEDDRETNLLPSAITVDLFAQTPLGGGFSAVARAENLLDEDVITRNQGGSIDLGVPRTIWLGVRYGF
ncbi:TonB-dependent receptor plug domain-containing protein [Altericroceibacterium endophyticum]|uniref:TonB-dependent receptor n=1 Tax=Altericroceibacterium endophyticum TaxID=1808508 RepID=A0A6I4T5B0_9SPHN|nr:TonB-dependent receptor [Altericroceibacterium endophyticum]MXO65223.1 TonB-dependent receptor [Altericroceibacterium endophyticum]